MKLSVLYKHQIIMREQGKPERMLGNFISFNDSQNFGKVASTIFINGFRSVRDVGDLSQCDTFLFGFDPAKEYNKELIKFHGWLSMNAQKAAVIILDKHQSHAIIIPALYDDEAALKAVGFKSGFICKVYENRNPDKKPVVVPDEPFYDPSSVYGSSSSSVPSFNNPPSSSSYNPTITRAPSIDYTSASSYSYLNPTTLGSLGSMANPPSISAPPIVPVAVSVAAATSNLTAEDHYNKLKRSKETRHQSQLFHMRNLNNFTKAELIEEAIQLIASQPPPSSSAQRSRQTNRRGCTVLELACGKGGDIMKWMKNSYAEITRYVGIDIAENSIKEFVERLTKRPDNLSERVIIEKLIVGNLNQDSLISSSLLTHSWLQHGLRSEWKQMIPLQSSDAFDIISCQFAMHYMFGTAKSVKHFFTEVSRHLNESGLYIATTIDYRILVHYIMKAKYGPMESAMKNTTHQVITSSPLETTMSTSLPTNYDTAPGFKSKEVIKDSVKYLALQFYNEFQKLLLQIELKQETVDRLLGRLSNNNADEDDWFGVEYNFILHDSDEEAAVNSPEFIVPIFTTHFQEILYQEKLEIMKIQNFHDFIIEKFDNDNSRDRMNKMEVFNVNGTISEAEWLIARLYTVLILKKVSNIAEKPKKVSVVPSLVPPEPNPISVVPDLQNPPRLRPSSPKYPPRRIGALIDPKDPVVLNHQARFANLLTTTTNGNAAKKRTHDALEDQEEIRENIEETNEEDEEDFEFLEKVREKAIELVGGSEQWDELPDEEIERFITKAKTLLKSSQSINGKAPWKVYPPRSPDHPPPQLRNKMETVAEEENEDGDEDDSIAKMQRIRSRAVELAGGEEAWENLDDECCDDFFAVARKQLEQERNKI